jgi:pimeloyl-ACP methyl ester carboxylesterase
MHFTETMDHWDPALTDGFAHDRGVILFNNAGMSSSSGEVPTLIEEMAQHAAAFIDALGFSMGGLIAQQFTIDRPDLVRKLILVGTGPRSGEGMAPLTLPIRSGFESSLLHRSGVRRREGSILSGRRRARRTGIRCRMKRLLRHR